MEKLLHTRKFKIINRCVLPVSALGIATLSGSIQMFCCCCKLFNEHHWIVLKHVIAISSRGDFFLKSALNITTVYFVLITTVVLKCWFEVKEAVLRFRLARVHIQACHGGWRGASWRRCRGQQEVHTWQVSLHDTCWCPDGHSCLQATVAMRLPHWSGGMWLHSGMKEHRTCLMSHAEIKVTAGLSGRNSPETNPIRGLFLESCIPSSLQRMESKHITAELVQWLRTLLTCKGPGLDSQNTYDT